ncbi:MAG: HlyC/CorC family transporter [Erysipelotrichaceae bacterium]|nr:HlyC/CorC family transporter [Erysipelotrichaceae bacterium]
MDPLSWSLLTVSQTNASLPEKGVFGYIVLLLLLILVNAYFAASELAIVSLNDAKLEKMAQEGNRKARSLFEMTSKPTTFLSTIQIGVTLSGFLSSAVAADTFADYIVYLFRNLSIDLSVVRIISIFVITLLLSFVTLVFGELLPKRIAIKDPERVAFAVSGSLKFFYSLFKPIVWLVSKTVNALANALGIKESDGQQEYTEEEIRIMVDAGNEKGLIESERREMINNVFEFNDRTVGEIMTHRTDMEALELTEGLNEVIKRFSESGHSRIPVYDEDIDDIVGMLYVKDLLELFVDESKREKFTIKKYMREPMFVYENLKCDDLFDEFQKTKVQVAIVLDEYGGTYGIVSMEDLLESIVGDIQDEFDDEDQEFEELNENHYIVDGAALIDDVSKLIDIELDDSENDTIGGLVMDKLGYVPEEDEHPSVQIGRAIFTIKNMDDKSIDKIDIVITPEKQEEEK